MFTFDPELDAQVPADRMQGLYGRSNELTANDAERRLLAARTGR
jgi:hypothetical protein